MIWLMGKCVECPAYWKGDTGHCGCTKNDGNVIDDALAGSGRPEWCPLKPAGMTVHEVKEESAAVCENWNDVRVFACNTCPFYYQTDKRRCNIGNPKGRPIHTEDPRPTWCPLRKESVIVRNRAK